MSQIAQKVMKAKVALLLQERLFGNLVTYLIFRENPAIPTACTDGTTLEYNPEFFGGCTRTQIMGVMAHEVLHCAFKHHLYRGNRDAALWNIAGDYVVNLILKDHKFDLPGNPPLDGAYRGMHTVQVYNILANQSNKVKKQGQGEGEGEGDGQNPPSMGEVIDSPNISSGNSTETEKEDNVWTQRLAQALTSSKLGKRAGSSLGSFERAIQELLYPRVPWREVLWSLVQEVTKEDYSFLRPNRRYSSTPFCIPSLYSERIGSIIVAVDTSGSISQKDIDQFAAEIEEIMVCMNTTLHVVYCDTKVRGSQTFEPGDPVTLKPAGGGGTRYSPVFEWVEKEEMEPACLIYLTDGYCSDFPKETTVGYSTIWVTNRDGWEAPFGSMVRF